MNVHKKRLVRTRESEQYALFDLDQTDANLDPLSIGKLDLHYTADGTYGTLLLWREIVTPMDEQRRELLVHAVLSELSTTMGISADYALEVFVPEMAEYELYSNMQDVEPAAPAPDEADS